MTKMQIHFAKCWRSQNYFKNIPN